MKGIRTEWLWGAFGGASFLLLLGLEIGTENDDIELADVIVDALTLALTIAAAVGCAVLAVRWQQQRDEREALLLELEAARIEGAHWRSQLRDQFDGVRSAIELQFDAWSMTEAECDIGILMLKGLSHKEIANLRGTTQTTVRQQAGAIYRKASLPGKNAFCAYFLEDLLADDSEPMNGKKVGQSNTQVGLPH